MNIYQEDLTNVINNKLIDWSKFNNNNIFISGSTGVIGRTITNIFIMVNELFNYNINLLLLVRNKNKAISLFGEKSYIKYIEGSNEEFNCKYSVDYIIHAASPTKSKYFVEHSIETLDSAVIGIKNVLELADKNNITSMVYLSSMEVYGTLSDNNVTENKLGYIDLFSSRSCYPEGKRLSELYCNLYVNQRNTPVKTARLAMTFGAGIPKEENRVYKQFADAVLAKEDIVLKSSGQTVINFVYLSDAIEAILLILLNGENGKAYNVVSDPMYMTIKDSAEWLVETYSPDNKVVIECDENGGFAPINNMILNNEEIKSVGWKPNYTLKDGYKRLISYLKEL